MNLAPTSSAAARLIDGHDAALFDLDGVVYLGPEAIPGAAEGIAALRDAGVHVGFVTNNAARTPAHVATHLAELGVAAQPGDVVTSAQACARLMAEELPAGALVLVVGAAALVDEIRGVGLTPVESFRDHPVAVVQGYDPAMTWPRLDDACFAIQRGARWFATNTDSNRPTDLGLVPGAGSQIAVVANAVEGEPTVAGKPHPPLMHETMRRLEATRPIFVGDRIDTDIMGAVAVGIDSLFVFTGAHGKADLAATGVEGRPTHIGWDLLALLDPPRTVERLADEPAVRCGRVTARVVDQRVTLEGVSGDACAQLDAVWAVLQLIWNDGANGDDALASLTLVP